MQNSSSVDIANVNVINVSQGIMIVVDRLDDLKKVEKEDILTAALSCLHINNMKKDFNKR